ncbi:Por secretion system C-terminal sorting domain-containing protein [Candidatus Kryptobacter tengchongensis]|nr:Por secretion system C-terminal sorting domain-containing protein [Candidatus Kryptobacter tengchongensis]
MKGVTLRIYFVTFVLFFTSANLISQFGEWRNYTDMKNVRKIFVSTNEIVAGTEGGIFIFYPDERKFEKILKVDGLYDVDIKTMAVIPDKNIFAGFSNGVIDILNFSSKSYKVKHVFDIINSPEPDKTINFLKAYGDTLFIGTNFGLLTYRISKQEFIDTYRRIFADVERSKVFDVEVLNDTIYVATSEGVAKGYRFSQILVSPMGWKTLRISGGVKTFGVLRDRIYFGNSDGLFLIDGDNIVKISSLPVNLIHSAGDSILVSTGQEIFSYKDNQLQKIAELLYGNITDISMWRNKIVAGVFSNGVGIFENGEWDFYYPDGPNGNQFSNLAVDKDGNLWVASSKFMGKGFYKFQPKEGKWKNFTKKNFPKMSDDCYRVRVGKNFVWIGTWGGGLIRVDENDSLKIFSKNEGIMGVVEDTNFVVVTDIAEQGDYTWILNYKPRNLNIIYLMRGDSIVYSFVNGYNLSHYLNIQLELDEKGRKWIVSEHGFIFAFDDNGTIFDKSDDKWIAISKAEGLNGNPTVIKFDNRGDLWVGTNYGLNIIVNTDEPLKSGSIRNVFALRDFYINDIAIDGANNKWVATKNGVWVLSPDGTSVLAQYDASNSPILSDDVKAIAFDLNSGVVYFGTDKGLTTLKTEFAKPVENFNTIKIYPNPFNPERDLNVVIDGLVANSTIKIFTISGNLVKTILTPGGRTGIWDGKDEKGQYAPTGIYIVVAYSEDGTQVGIGKLAVLRD